MAIGRRRHKNQGQKRESPSNLQFMLLCENSLFHQRLFSHCLAPLCVMPHSNKEGCSEGKSLLGRENKGAHSSLLVIIFPLIDRDFYNQLTICGDKVIIGKVLEQPFQVLFLEKILYPNFHKHGNWEYSIANLQLCTLSRA